MSDKKKLDIKKAGIKIKNPIIYYIIVPLAFALAVLIILIPVFIKADKLAESYIAVVREKTANSSSVIAFNDDEYIASDVTEGTVKPEKEFEKGNKIGTLICENAGVNSDVYYGCDVRIFNRGAGLNTDYGLFGENKPVYLEGLKSEAFKNFDNIAAGDIIEIKTVYGVFEYRASDESVEASKADLVLCSYDSSKPFADVKKNYICAYKIAGPSLLSGEVQ